MLKILINGFNTFFIRRFCINIYTSWAFFFSMLSFWICLLACSIFLLLLRTVHLMGPEHCQGLLASLTGPTLKCRNSVVRISIPTREEYTQQRWGSEQNVIERYLDKGGNGDSTEHWPTLIFWFVSSFKFLRI